MLFAIIGHSSFMTTPMCNSYHSALYTLHNCTLFRLHHALHTNLQADNVYGLSPGAATHAGLGSNTHALTCKHALHASHGYTEYVRSRVPTHMHSCVLLLLLRSEQKKQ